MGAGGSPPEFFCCRCHRLRVVLPVRLEALPTRRGKGGEATQRLPKGDGRCATPASLLPKVKATRGTERLTAQGKKGDRTGGRRRKRNPRITGPTPSLPRVRGDGDGRESPSPPSRRAQRLKVRLTCDSRQRRPGDSPLPFTVPVPEANRRLPVSV